MNHTDKSGLNFKTMKKYSQFFLVTLLVSFMNSAYTQRPSNHSLGNLVSHEYREQALHLKTDFGNAIITIYDDGIIRLRIVKDEFIENFSYAVIAQPNNTDANFIEENDKLIIKTSLVSLEIGKNPVRFTFYSNDGTLLSTDDPAFGTSWIGSQVTTYKTLQEGERFLGLGEKTGNLDRRGSAYVNWNTDNPRYGPADDPLYVSIPFYIGVLKNKVYGIFLDNSYRTEFNFGASNDRFSSFSAEEGEMDYYFIHDQSMRGIIDKYTQLTGKMTMPPLWALGFQQSRWSYFPDTEVMDIAKNFRERRIPLDVMYLDIHYMDAYKIFTWHPTRFSAPEKLLSNLKDMGIHTTVIIDPGIKVEKGYEAYEDGLKKDVFAKYPDGSVYTAQVWPGWCHFPDFTKPAAREWWGVKFKPLIDQGIDGFWNDMNEIASWGGGFTPSLVNFDWEGEKTTYRQAKNVYGMMMAKSTYEGTRNQMNGRRPLILTRAGYAGLQRYTALWTGDNQSTEEHMILGTRLVNSLGLSGVSFAGVDVGGFSQNATPSLFARWLSIGAFTPFFRSHTHYDTRQSEPWSYGEVVENISRNYIQLRYKLLPYIYSTFHESTVNGMPVARSLSIDYTYDENIYLPFYQNQYMFGPSFLVAPVESTKELVKVYLPKGNWYNFNDGRTFEGETEVVVESPLHQLPIFIKAGSIIPMQKAVQFSGENPGDSLFIHVFAGDDPGTFNYYEDDGLTYSYEDGQFYSRVINYDPLKKNITFEASQGKFASKFKFIEVILHGFSYAQLKLNNRNIKVENTEVDFLNALSATTPSFLEETNSRLKGQKFTINNQNERIQITW